MKKHLAILAFSASVFFPSQVLAADTPVSRREAFLLLWQSIQRPALDTNEAPFSDVPDGAHGSKEITYAKARGILDDDEKEFQPDASLRLQEAILWMFRTRSIDDIDELTVENLSVYLEKYPIAHLAGNEQQTLTLDELLTLMRSFDAKLEEEVHEVSNYGIKFHGKGTAFGESFNMHALTAAHRTLPYNTLVKVTNIANGKSVTVRINDRGPFVEGRDMDLSTASFDAISGGATGILNARFQRLGDADLVLGCGKDLSFQKRITRDVILSPGVPWMLPLGESVSWESDAPFVLLRQTYPDGMSVKMQNWFMPGETFTFEPSISGTYKFLLGTKQGRRRELQMTVSDCSRP